MLIIGERTVLINKKLLLQSIAEGLKSNDLKGHSRSPSTASSTSQEVAEINSNKQEVTLNDPPVTSEVKDADPNTMHNNNTEQSEPKPLSLNIAAANDHGKF